MEPGQVADELVRQLAHLARGDVDAQVGQRRLDLFSLPLVKEPLEAHEDHHVVADVAAGQKPLPQ
jgi:hypothetical protein